MAGEVLSRISPKDAQAIIHTQGRDIWSRILGEAFVRSVDKDRLYRAFQNPKFIEETARVVILGTPRGVGDSGPTACFLIPENTRPESLLDLRQMALKYYESRPQDIALTAPGESLASITIIDGKMRMREMLMAGLDDWVQREHFPVSLWMASTFWPNWARSCKRRLPYFTN